MIIVKNLKTSHSRCSDCEIKPVLEYSRIEQEEESDVIPRTPSTQAQSQGDSPRMHDMILFDPV